MYSMAGTFDIQLELKDNKSLYIFKQILLGIKINSTYRQYYLNHETNKPNELKQSQNIHLPINQRFPIFKFIRYGVNNMFEKRIVIS